MTAIESEKLCVQFKRLPVLKEVSFTVRESTVCALLGPNGAGKTTLLRTLINIYQPSSGKASLLGRETTKLKPEDFEEIGFVSEAQEVPLMMKGEAFLKMCSHLYPQWDQGWCDELVRTLDIQLDSRLKDLSRGTLVKLKLISSLAFRPKLLLMDEPFSGLDPIVRDETIAVIIELCQRSGATVFISSHDLHEVERIADSVLFLNQGTIKEHASLDSLLERYRAVSLTLEEGEPLPGNHPAHWGKVEVAGRSVQFVHKSYSPERLAEELAALQVKTTALEAAPLTLKEIYRAVMEAR